MLSWAFFLGAVLQFHRLSTPVAAGYICLALAIESIHVVLLSFAADVHYDANSFTLPALLVSLMYAFVLTLLYSRRIFAYSAATTAVSTAIYVFSVACILVQHVLLPMLASFERVLIRVQCDAAGTCTNPCTSLSKSLMRDSMSMDPVIWKPTDAQKLSHFSLPNEWVRNAAKLDSAGYEFLSSLHLWYFMLAPVFYTVQTNLNLPPREARNKIFQSLQESHRPRDTGQSRIKYYGRWFVLKLRYLRFIIKPISLALQMKLALYTTIKTATEARRKGKKREPPPNYVVVPCQSALRHTFGKTIAALWYFWSYSLYVFLPVYTIMLIVETELSLGWLPSYGRKQPLPSWVPLIIIAITLVAGLIPVVQRTFKTWNQRDVYSGNSEEFEAESLLFMGHDNVGNMPLRLQLVAVVKGELREFLRWWRDPIGVSSMDSTKRVEDGENGGYSMELKGWTGENGYPMTSRAAHKPFAG